jgi:hypothetical protein
MEKRHFKERIMATYIGFTHTGGNHKIVSIANDKTDAYAQAKNAIGYGDDIYTVTERLNLMVLPQSDTRRVLGHRVFHQLLDAYLAEQEGWQ